MNRKSEANCIGDRSSGGGIAMALGSGIGRGWRGCRGCNREYGIVDCSWGCLRHGLFLAIINITSIIMAYGVFHVLQPGHQIVFQGSIAAVLSITVFTAWYWLVRSIPLKTLLFQSWQTLLGTFFWAMLWVPVIFIPLHLGTQGYLTAFSNIAAIWLFQIPTNLAAIFINRHLTKCIQFLNGKTFS